MSLQSGLDIFVKYTSVSFYCLYTEIKPLVGVSRIQLNVLVLSRVVHVYTCVCVMFPHSTEATAGYMKVQVLFAASDN